MNLKSNMLWKKPNPKKLESIFDLHNILEMAKLLGQKKSHPWDWKKWESTEWQEGTFWGDRKRRLKTQNILFVQCTNKFFFFFEVKNIQNGNSNNSRSVKRNSISIIHTVHFLSSSHPINTCLFRLLDNLPIVCELLINFSSHYYLSGVLTEISAKIFLNNNQTSLLRRRKGLKCSVTQPFSK